MRCSVVEPHDFGDVVWPGFLLLVLECSQETVKSSVEPFALAISARMVGCGAGLVDVQHLAQVFDDVAFEVSALITVYLGHDAVSKDPVVEEDLGSGLRGLIPCWNGDGELREDIGHDENILVALGFFQDRKVDRHGLKWSRRQERCLCEDHLPVWWLRFCASLARLDV